VEHVDDVDAGSNLDVEDEVLADRQAPKPRREVVSRASHSRRVGQALKSLPKGSYPTRCCSGAAVLGDVGTDISKVSLGGPRDAEATHRLRFAFASSWFSRSSWSRNSLPSTTSPRFEASMPMAIFRLRSARRCSRVRSRSLSSRSASRTTSLAEVYIPLSTFS